MTSQRKKLTASFIFFILVFTLFNQVIYHDVVAQQNTDVDESEEPKIGPLGNFFKFFGKLSTGLVPIFRLSVVLIIRRAISPLFATSTFLINYISPFC